MSDIEQPSETSTGLTAFQGIIIFFALVIGMIIIIYVIRNDGPILYPLSPFNYGDKVIISPVVLSQYGTGAQVSPSNQYLTANFTSQDCITNSYMPSGACTVTFTGDPTNPASHWILNQYFPSSIGSNNDPSSGLDLASNANQNIETGGFGNRFYLQNSIYDANQPAGRMRYNPFNSPCNSTSYFQPLLTIPTVGSTQSYQGCFTAPINYYYQDLLVYFMPTNYPDIYYMLFPGDITSTVVFDGQVYTNNSANNGILSTRPYADPNNNNYVPYDANGHLYPNGPLLNELSSVGTNPAALYNNPEIFLFRVTKL